MKAAPCCDGSEHSHSVLKCREDGKFGILHRNGCRDCTVQPRVPSAESKQEKSGVCVCVGCCALSFSFLLTLIWEENTNSIKDLILLLRKVSVTVAVTQSWLVLTGEAPVQQEALMPGEPGFC